MYNVFQYIEIEKLKIISSEFKLKEDELNTIKDIINIEWNFFDKVEGINGRAICQDSPIEFIINRMAQYLVYNDYICLCIQRDYRKHIRNNFNPIFGKYAKMMQFTDIDRYNEIKDTLPKLSPVKQYALTEISRIFDDALEKVEEIFPETSKGTRPRKSTNHRVSSIVYYISEISFFDLKTIWLIKDCIINTRGEKFVENIYKNTIKLKDILS